MPQTARFMIANFIPGVIIGWIVAAGLAMSMDAPGVLAMDADAWSMMINLALAIGPVFGVFYIMTAVAMEDGED